VSFELRVHNITIVGRVVAEDTSTFQHPNDAHRTHDEIWDPDQPPSLPTS
jgi:hypothetical protein